MKRFLAVLLGVLFLAPVLCAGVMNLKYLEREKNVAPAIDAETGVIVIKHKNNEVKLLLNYPYVISGGSIIRIDSAPQADNGEIFISEMAYEEITALLTGKKAEAPAIKVQAAVKETSVPDDGIYIKETEVPGPVVKAEAKAKKPEPTPAGTPLTRVTERSPKKDGPKVIILDPGHGGVDPGAVGPSGLYEKDVVLDIALRAEKLIKQQPGVKVLLTRSTDTFVSLKDRAIFANNNRADLFISIHCNASPNRRAKGTRTYIYSRVASSKEAAASAKFENRQVGMFEFLLNDLRKGAYELLSVEMAGNIQHSLVKQLRLKWEPTERAPFYVLSNTNMPSVLVESAFISNRDEEKKLNTPAFREQLAQGIHEGVKEYLERTK